MQLVAKKLPFNTMERPALSMEPARGAPPACLPSSCLTSRVTITSITEGPQKRITGLATVIRPPRRFQASTSSLASRWRARQPRITTCTLAVEKAAQIRTSNGDAKPLGVSLAPEQEGAINFALFSKNARQVTLCLFMRGDMEVPTVEIPLDASSNRTGDIWHICVEGLPLSGVLYGYRVAGPSGWDKGHRFDPSKILLDPYAKLVEGRRVYGDQKKKMAPFLGTFDFESEPFDWGSDYKLPNIPEEDLIIYEMPVRAFTADASSGLEEEIRGSYRGLASKVEYLKELGVNAVELLPVFEFDEFEFQRRKNDRDHMLNTWGYSTINFFSPNARFASNGGGPVAAAREFKEMVKALHMAGIEVILDVVYNHTNEADDQLPYMTSFRGIDNQVYYMVDLNNFVQLMNFTGCGNTFNCNHPVVMDLVLDSLRHWVTEYHVDGFRFDLASSLCRDTDGTPMGSPPVIRAITKDPVLSRVKLIAEPWDCGGLYQVGSFPNWDRWFEWNGKYRDDVRQYIKGDRGMKSSFATRLSGSADLYNKNKRKPFHSINFVIAHDGFSLMDLVSYNSKHNEANGEGGRDGSNDNLSWNCGVEGPTGDEQIKGLRFRQMKNFQVALMLSQGTPMFLMGDEYGHTRRGNNNSYGHDTDLNHFQWKQLEGEKSGLFRFFSLLNKFRRSHPLLGRDTFLNKEDVTWHEDNWENADSRFLAFSLHDKGLGGGDIYAAFNAHDFFVKATLPPAPAGKKWMRMIDTNLPSPKDIVDNSSTVVEGQYNIAPYSSIVLTSA